MLKRKIKVTFRLDEKEMEHLKKQVARCGYSQEAYIRSVLKGRIPKETPPVDYYQMTKQLCAIGNLMNQIAARANATGFFMTDKYVAYAKELHEQIMKIRAAIEQPERSTDE